MKDTFTVVLIIAGILAFVGFGIYCQFKTDHNVGKEIVYENEKITVTHVYGYDSHGYRYEFYVEHNKEIDSDRVIRKPND